jgi:hypothetical protein
MDETLQGEAARLRVALGALLGDGSGCDSTSWRTREGLQVKVAVVDIEAPGGGVVAIGAYSDLGKLVALNVYDAAPFFGEASPYAEAWLAFMDAGTVAETRARLLRDRWEQRRAQHARRSR